MWLCMTPPYKSLVRFLCKIQHKKKFVPCSCVMELTNTPECESLRWGLRDSEDWTGWIIILTQ